jgi:hypothetical protein
MKTTVMDKPVNKKLQTKTLKGNDGKETNDMKKGGKACMKKGGSAKK